MDRRESAALDRYITGNYGEDSAAKDGVLSDECEAELDGADMYSEPAVSNDGWAQIRTSEGDAVAIVTRDIDLLNLRALILFGTRQFMAGYECGKRDMQGRFRALINAAPLEPSA